LPIWAKPQRTNFWDGQVGGTNSEARQDSDPERRKEWEGRPERLLTGWWEAGSLAPAPARKKTGIRDGRARSSARPDTESL
jgi:hypothetical protein